jgi:hypothetical protein
MENNIIMLLKLLKYIFKALSTQYRGVKYVAYFKCFWKHFKAIYMKIGALM